MMSNALRTSRLVVLPVLVSAIGRARHTAPHALHAQTPRQHTRTPTAPPRHLATTRAGPPPMANMPNIDGTGSLRSLQEYPCELMIKAIGDNLSDEFPNELRRICAAITGQEPEAVPVSHRDKGKYRSVTMRLKFQDADTVYAVYKALDEHPDVKYKL